jgi:hypothetical protein
MCSSMEQAIVDVALEQRGLDVAEPLFKEDGSSGAAQNAVLQVPADGAR